MSWKGKLGVKLEDNLTILKMSHQYTLKQERTYARGMHCVPFIVLQGKIAPHVCGVKVLHWSKTAVSFTYLKEVGKCYSRRKAHERQMKPSEYFLGIEYFAKTQLFRFGIWSQRDPCSCKLLSPPPHDSVNWDSNLITLACGQRAEIETHTQRQKDNKHYNIKRDNGQITFFLTISS